MKKLINDPADVVAEALLGVAAAHPELRVDHENKIIYRGDAPRPGKVGLISGGGSGHEPLHGGFVGLGMLDAACAGEVFTSPVPDQMLEATKNVDGGAGVLHIVKNYTGDVMNFEMAAELAAAETGVEVVSIVTDDDVAVQDSTWTAGRRGVGVTVLLEKIVGAAAEEGRSLAEVADLARTVNAKGRSMGMALTSCTVPAAGQPTFDLPDTEMEIGVGIHGEPGRRRVPLAPAKEIAEMLVEPILADLEFSGRRRRHRLRQRHGWDAAARALPHVQRGQPAAREGRGRRGPVPGRLLHHQPGDGRLLGDAAQGRRRAAAPVGRSGQDSGTPLGSVIMGGTVDVASLDRWLREFARVVQRQQGAAHPARLRDR